MYICASLSIYLYIYIYIYIDIYIQRYIVIKGVVFLGWGTFSPGFSLDRGFVRPLTNLFHLDFRYTSDFYEP